MEALTRSVFVSKFSETQEIIYSIRTPNKRSGSLKINESFANTASSNCGSRILAVARQVSDEGEEEKGLENGFGSISEESVSLSEVTFICNYCKANLFCLFLYLFLMSCSGLFGC